MKKGFIIGLGVLLTALLLAPWVVGLFVERWVAERMGADGNPAEYQYHRNWRQSRLEAHLPDGSTLIAHARHAPLQPLALAAFDGVLLLATQPHPVAFQGRLSVDGTLHASARVAALQWFAEAYQVTADEVEITLVSAASRGDLKIAAAGLNMVGPEPLRLAPVALQLRWRQTDPAVSVAGTVTATRSEQPVSMLDIRIDGMAREPLIRMTEALVNLRAARREDRGRELALLGVAGAWQHMKQQGVTVELMRLSLDDAFELTGYWRYAGRGAEQTVRGAGARSSVQGWLAPFFSRGRQDVDMLLAGLEQRGWLVAQDDQLHITSP